MDEEDMIDDYRELLESLADVTEQVMNAFADLLRLVYERLEKLNKALDKKIKDDDNEC